MFTTSLPTAGAYGRMPGQQDPNDPTKRMQPPQGQSQPMPQPSRPLSFADMQKQGIARPPAPTSSYAQPMPGASPYTTQPQFPQFPGGSNPMSGEVPPPQPAPSTATGTGTRPMMTPPAGPTDTTPGSTTGPVPNPSATTPTTFPTGTPVTPNGGGTFPMQQQLMDALSNLFTNGSAYNSDAVTREYNQLAQGIDDQYSLGVKQAKDNLAQRGLGSTDDSSLGLGKLSDLNVARKTAKEQAAADLATKQAESQNQAIQQAIQGVLGLGGLQVQQQTGGINALLQYLQTLIGGGAATPQTATTGA